MACILDKSKVYKFIYLLFLIMAGMIVNNFLPDYFRLDSNTIAALVYKDQSIVELNKGNFYAVAFVYRFLGARYIDEEFINIILMVAAWWLALKNCRIFSLNLEFFLTSSLVVFSSIYCIVYSKDIFPMLFFFNIAYFK